MYTVISCSTCSSNIVLFAWKEAYSDGVSFSNAVALYLFTDELNFVWAVVSGMKFDLASVTSQDVSSAWADAIPKLVQRRGGIAMPMAGTLRNYSDSGKLSSSLFYY